MVHSQQFFKYLIIFSIKLRRRSQKNIYKVRFKKQKNAQKLIKTVNEYCFRHLQNLWVDVRDKMIQEGIQILEDLVIDIQGKIQAISNQLFSDLSESLEIELNISLTFIPLLNFEGMIDGKVGKVLGGSNIQNKNKR